jgi:predicted metal-binding membrane protein
VTGAATRAATGTAPTLRQLTLPASVLLVVGAAAWVGVVAVSRGMGDMPGTMGLGFGAFVAVWALMMTAMMLPTVAPFTALYTRTLTDHKARRIVELACGYLLVWTLAALPAFLLAWGASELVGSHPGAATVVAVVVFAACGLYQLTPLKDRCLSRCRSPLGFVMKYGSYKGRLRDMRVGMDHGAFCLGCCWALMAVLVAVGLMNVLAMVVLAGVVLVEKTWRWGPRFSRVVGVLALVLAVVVVFRPSLAAGLQPSPQMSGGEMVDAPMS